MAINDNMLVKIQPSASDTFIKNLIGDTNVGEGAGGTATVTLVNDNGLYGHRIQGEFIGSFLGGTAYEGGAVTMAVRFKANARSGNFAQYFAAKSTGNSYGPRIQNAGSATGNLRATEAISSGGSTTIGSTAYTTGQYVTLVIICKDNGFDDGLHAFWKGITGRTSNNPDATSTPNSANRTTGFNTITFGAAGEDLTVVDFVVWQRALTQAEASAVADDIRAALAPVAASAVTISGPSGGVSGVASSNYTVGANGTIAGTVVVTPNDNSGGGTFTPTTVSISEGTPSATFKYTPASPGTKTISLTNNASLSNPANMTYVASASAATALTLSGPATSTVGSASTNYTVAANGSLSTNVVVTPNDGGAGGTFSPSTVTLTSSVSSANFTYTAASAGAKNISVTNNGGLANPAAVSTTASTSAATAVVVTGPTSGPVSTASSNFTVSANGAITGTVIVTPNDNGGGGTFSPTTVSISAGAPTGTFTYTPATSGNKTLSFTNNGSLANQANLSYNASNTISYLDFGNEQCDNVMSGLMPDTSLTAIIIQRNDLSQAKQVVTGITTNSLARVPKFAVSLPVGTPVHVLLVPNNAPTETAAVSDHSTVA